MEALETVSTLKKKLDSLRPISREQELRIMQKFRLDWNYHSNNLEGNSLTYGETKALILFGLTAQGKPLRDHLEIEGHNQAIEWIIDIVKGDYPLNEAFIREIHIQLLKQPYMVDAITAEGAPTTKRIEIGKYKSQPNHVLTKTGEIFRFATPEETPALMGDLIDWYRTKTNNPDINPVLLAAEFHYKFIRIHPFDDGNGRTARILMNFILMRYNFPPVIIKTEEKNEYFSALRLADSGTIEAFVNYIAANLAHSLEIMIRGAKGESIEDPTDLDKELALLELKLTKGNKESSRTPDSVRRLFSESLVPLFKEYLSQAKKFDRFYINPTHNLRLNDTNFGELNEAEKEIELRIDTNTIKLSVLSSFQGFIHPEYGFNSFFSGIEVILGNNSYTIMDWGQKYSQEKSYHNQLNEGEINKIVKSESQRHKQLIEDKIGGEK